MPAKGRRSDYIILAVLAIATMAVLILLMMHGWFREGRQEAVIRTSHSTNVEGTMVAYVLFQRLGMPLQRSERPLLKETLDKYDVVMVIDPIMPLEEGEVLALRDWIRRGGILICTASTGQLQELHEIGVEGGREASASSHGPAGDSDNAPTGPLARDVISASFRTRTTLASDSEGGSSPSGAVKDLFTDTVGMRIAARKFGAGQIIVLSDSSFLANGRIGKADNAVLAVNLLAYAAPSGKGAAFDEYHYGMIHRETARGVMASMLFGTSPGWAVLSLTAAALLFLIYKGRRFGTRLNPGRVRRRSKLEYVHSVGATYRGARAHRLTLKLIYQWFRRRMAWVAGLPESASLGEISARLAQRTGRSRNRYEGVFRRCERALAMPRISGRRAAELVNQLAAVESEVFDGSQSGK